jgi:dihydrolipoamide dehydrogenase
MATKIVIIGAGSGGYVAALRAAQLGAEVTVIERDKIGGICLHWGCIPSKIMKTTAQLIESFKRSREFGIEREGEVHPNMSLLMDRKEKIIQNQSDNLMKLFYNRKIRFIGGHGYIKGPNRVEVRRKNGETLELPWDRLILALGSQPSNIPSLPFDGERIISSNEAVNLRKIPESILIVGAGIIGCEFAFILSSLGSKVTLVEALSRILPIPFIDEDCSKIMQREMKKRKINFMVNHTVKGVEKTGKKLRVTIEPSPFSAGMKEKNLISPMEVETLLVCIGRSPLVSNVGLEGIGIETDEKGWIITDEKMETAIPGVYAVGDVLGPSRVMLAHVASAEGIVAAENAMGGGRIMRYDAIPAGVYTAPEVASVGLTEVQAKTQGYPVRADSVLLRHLGMAHVIGEIAGQAKIVSDSENGRILGVQLVGPHATELIAEATLAVRMGCRVEDLADTIHAHPTLSEVLLEAAFKSLDKSLYE